MDAEVKEKEKPFTQWTQKELVAEVVNLRLEVAVLKDELSRSEPFMKPGSLEQWIVKQDAKA